MVSVEAVDPCPEDEADCARFRIFDPQEFYALDDDPAELENRYADSDRVDEIQGLRKWLAKELADKPSGTADSVELDDEIRRQLKSLGYLN